MAFNLTYDPSEAVEGELNSEEQEALEVGEQLEQEQQQLLAGKFRDAQDLERAYLELQKKLGDPERVSGDEVEETSEESVEEEVEEDVSEVQALLDRLYEESLNEYSEETLEAIRQLPPEELAQAYLEARAAAEQTDTVGDVSPEDIQQLQGIVGGPEQYNAMIAWASENLSQQEVEMYDSVMDRGDPMSMFFAVQALAYRYNDAYGTDGRMVSGRAPIASGDVFRSQAEVVRAMSDPRYDDDPAYRQDVYDKLERSNLNF